MAAVLATVNGIAIKPGVSLNRRWYPPEMLAAAVVRAQARMDAGESLDLVDRTDEPVAQLTHHDAVDDSTRIVGRVTSLTLGENGDVLFTAAIAPTDHGKTIAALLDTSDGRPPYLRGVSIRGTWLGKLRVVTGPDGKPAETADGLELDGLDYTRKPGVPGARVTGFAWSAAAGEGGETARTARMYITESVQEALVTVTEGTTPAPPEAAEPVREALAVLFGEPSEAGDPPAISKRGSGMTGGSRKYADPGYQKDHKQRYDITDKAHAITAWRYINQAAKAAKYSSNQLKNIKSRIRSALKGFGVSVSSEHAPGWGFSEAYQVTDAVAEYYGDPARSGSWCVSASNGPVNLSLSSYSMDPADLDVILRAAADAACKALATLDPDMDGDVDVDGVGSNSDTDDDSGHETAPETGPPALPGEQDPAEAGTTETEDPAMAEDTSTTQAGGESTPATGLTAETLAAIGAAVAEGLKTVLPAAAPAAPAAPLAAPAAPAAPVAEDADARTARIVAETLKAAGFVPGTAQAAPAAPAETAPATPAAPAVDPAVIRAVVAEALGVTVPAAPAAPPAAAAPAAPAETAPAGDLASQVKAMVTEAVQGLVATGQVTPEPHGLTGFTAEHAVSTGADGKAKSAEDLRSMDEDGFQDYAGAALDNQVFGARGKALHGTDGGMA